MAARKPGTIIDIDNITLVDGAGRNLVRNGDFSRANAWWYFSSDHHHLPWHAKNLPLHLLFEQGWVGVALIAMLYLIAMREYLRRLRSGDALAAAPLAALAGFAVVGAFDSLLDVPRLAFLLYLLLFQTLVGPRQRLRANARVGAQTGGTQV
jgi:O-antigen ligase